MNKVMVIGNAGGGKSTLCRRLSNAHDLPHLKVDDIMWRPGWQRSPEADFLQQHETWLATDRWLIDGVGSMVSVIRRLAAADTVIYVDLPLHVHAWWAAKRQVASLFSRNADGPVGCPMWRMTLRLPGMMWWMHRYFRPELQDLLAQLPVEKTVIILRSKHQLRAFRLGPDGSFMSDL